MANFLTHPCLETIEACLIIGNALAYNMNPGVAYIFLGMTLRSGLSMGLHVDSHEFSDHEKYLRGRIWWALAWQDSHFSVSYDRPSSSIMCTPSIPYTADSSPGNRSYVETLSAIIRLTQEIIRDRTISPSKAMSFSTIKKYKDHLYSIIADAAPRLKDRSLCQCTTEHMERLAFQLHYSYMLSEICRPALREMAPTRPTSRPGPNTPIASPQQQGRRKSSVSANSVHSANSPAPTSCPSDSNIQPQLRAECVNALEGTVGAYVELHTHSIFACRSWIGIQRCISAAFILGILPETQKEPRILRLLQNLETCIAKRTSEDVGFTVNTDHLSSPMLQSARRMSVVNTSRQPGMSESPNWTRSMTKSLGALRKLNATLASSNENNRNQSQTSTYTQTSTSFPQQASTGMHSARVGSPMNNNGQKVSNNGSSMMPLSINQYPSITLSPHMHPSYAHQQRVPVSNLVNVTNSGPYNSGMAMSQMPPEGASNSDWHYWNITERALEYVQPGLWG